MPKPTLVEMRAFVAVATHRSFRRAADDLAMVPSSLSHIIRGLEQELGLRLLHRTTRSVALTQAGHALLDRLRPALHELDLSFDALADHRGRPSGVLRINASETASRMLLGSTVPVFLDRYPEMTLDLVSDGRLVDIVADGFDAGVRLGEAVPQDMVAVPFGAPSRFVAVASPDYLAAHPSPQTPDDLSNHRCIRIRMPSGKAYRWEFERHGQEITIDVPGRLILDDPRLIAQAATAGLGIAYVAIRTVSALISSGRLVPILTEWCPIIPGLCLYYPGHRHVPAGLRAFVDVLKETLPAGDPESPETS